MSDSCVACKEAFANKVYVRWDVFGWRRKSEKDAIALKERIEPQRAEPVEELTLAAAEKRAEGRKPAFKIGTITTPDGKQTINCVARDVSRHGVQIQLEGAQVLNERMVITLHGLCHKQEVEIRWQNGTRAGLLFIGKAEDL